MRDASFCLLSLRERIELKRLCAVARRLDSVQAIPATSSNFSLRAGANAFLISRSGIHKRLLEPSHFIRAHLTGMPVNIQAPKPSDETLLHAMLYKNLPSAGAIVHCHARELEFLRAPKYLLEGHELLKALGTPDHETDVVLPVFKNSQNMAELAQHLEQNLFGVAANVPQSSLPVFGFMLERHGIYIVGKNIAEAELRTEALLHLLATQNDS